MSKQQLRCKFIGRLQLSSLRYLALPFTGPSQYALGTSFTVSVDADATSVEVVNAGDQVWKLKRGKSCPNISIEQVASSTDRVDISGTFDDAAYANWSWTLSFSLDSDDSQTLAFNASVDGVDVTNVYLAYESPPEEAFFGLGEQTGIGNLRGWRVPIWTREGGAGRGEEAITSVLNVNPSAAGIFPGGSLLTTYTAIASPTSSLGRWIVLDGTNYVLFNLASNATSP
ncbi:unnamed protein product [Phytophthora lilii]|uniref:Unnamed protein product n=1 Tax=Phytophthora lilii TaxID=2077276 RepID=A0A9W6TJG4_9STRA|nr:unnamed protein product [Phytophthora lilii]